MATPGAASATGPPPPQPQPVTAPPSEAIVTPTLISQVNAAAESNPTLSKLLHTAAAGRATPEELRTLGLLTRSVGIGVDPPPPPAPAPPAPAPSQVPEQPAPLIPPEPVKEFDLVIEFQERLSDKWVFPRGFVSIEVQQPITSLSSRFDVSMNVALPFSTASGSLAAEKGTQLESVPVHQPSRVVTFRWVAVHQGVHELLMRWAGGESKIIRNRQILDDLVSVGFRS